MTDIIQRQASRTFMFCSCVVLFWFLGGCATGLTWHEAMASCRNGYRLPTLDEYMTVLGNCDSGASQNREGQCSPCAQSPVCSSMFGADHERYWTSSPYAVRSDCAWSVDTNDGMVDPQLKDTGYALARCVRSITDERPKEEPKIPKSEKH